MTNTGGIKIYFETPIIKLGIAYWRLTVTDSRFGGRVLNYEYRYNDRMEWSTLTTRVEDVYYGQSSSNIKIFGQELKKLYAQHAAEITAALDFPLSDRLKSENCPQESLTLNEEGDTR